ncbi:MAG: M36 family metallopeptidase [Myxococcales bacterium]|nr:M36 family metallopeptidase [Myxococcales bacterium]
MGNRSNLLRFTLIGLTLASACADGASPDKTTVETTTDSGARVLRGKDGALTGPSTLAARQVAMSFLADRLAVDGDGLQVVAEVGGRGATHVKLEQVVDGLRVHGAYAKVAVSDRGEVLQAIEHLAAGGAVAPTKLDAGRALATALRHLGYQGQALAAVGQRGNLAEYVGGREFYRNPTVERVAYVRADGSLAVGFVVETWSLAGNQLDYTLIGADGAIVDSERRTANDSYNVFVEDPLKGPQNVVAGPGAGNAESPSGWLAGSQTTVNITGNNAHAYLDADANNAPDTGGTAVTTGAFLTAVNLAAQPSTTGNKAVAVQNLFYLNNIAHDTLYRHGFNEAAGNFQANNFGLGGLGNDAVNAEAQDGSGTDNANFSTPNDGSAPRMQMYLWTGRSPSGLLAVGTSSYGVYQSSFGAAFTATGVTGALAVYVDGSGVTSDACETATVSLTGKIAIVDRGTCNFTVKVLNAQRAGAVGVILANNDGSAAFAPGGTDRKIKIPSGMVSQADGTTLKGRIGTSSTLKKNPVAALQIDGDVDSDIVFHEYGHGLTWRMVGGMSGKLAGAIGEGAADVNAFLIDGDDRIGEYAWGDAAGIRRYPYEGYPLTYANVDGGEVHNDGEIYAGAMWRVLQNYLAAGLTVDDAYGDFVDGLNFTPSTPAFEDMRDGMLQSAAGTGRECLIWRGFAASGIGVGADGRVAPSGSVTIVQSFAVPAGC